MTNTADDSLYGPQTADVLALVARASHLTEDEQDRLEDASGLVWDSEFDRAQEAALDVATAAGRLAQWTAATRAADEVAPTAAHYAAQALVVRDLVGTEYLTQARYDLLVRPWVTQVGEL